VGARLDTDAFINGFLNLILLTALKISLLPVYEIFPAHVHRCAFVLIKQLKPQASYTGGLGLFVEL
jgi:hypothetical protein